MLVTHDEVVHNNNGLDIKNLTSLRYCTPFQIYEQNKVSQQDLRQLYTQKNWITRSEPLPPTMAYYKDHMSLRPINSYKHPKKQAYQRDIALIEQARYAVSYFHYSALN